MKLPDPNRALPLSQAVSDQFNADIFFYSGGIDENGFNALAVEVARAKSRDNALLIITTNGGQAGSAYRIARLFQKLYNEFILFPPAFCMSAGTLISLGAHKLVMSPLSELGPLDVQLLEKDELFGRKSGLLMRSAFESLGDSSFALFEQFMLGVKARSGGSVSFKLASQIGSEIVSNLMSPVYGQISPDVVGSDYRDLKVATEYGYRLVRVSRNATNQAVDLLVSGYPAHDFIIDDDEARSLFKVIEVPSVELTALLDTLGPYVYSESPRPFVSVVHSQLVQSSVGADNPPDAGVLGAESVENGSEVSPPIEGDVEAASES